MKFTLPTGRYLQSHPLYYTVEIYESIGILDSHTVNMEILFPENYSSVLKQYDPILFRLSLLFNKDNVHISGFYNNTYIYYTFSTEDEINAVRRIGKDAIKTILRYLVENNLINSNAIVTLTASAHECVTSIEEIASKSNNELINEYLIHYPEDYDEYLRYLDRDYLISMVCRIIQNKKLISYYESLGFTVSDYSSGVGPKMSASVDRLI